MRQALGSPASVHPSLNAHPSGGRGITVAGCSRTHNSGSLGSARRICGSRPRLITSPAAPRPIALAHVPSLLRHHQRGLFPFGRRCRGRCGALTTVSASTWSQITDGTTSIAAVTYGRVIGSRCRSSITSRLTTAVGLQLLRHRHDRGGHPLADCSSRATSIPPVAEVEGRIERLLAWGETQLLGRPDTDVAFVRSGSAPRRHLRRRTAKIPYRSREGPSRCPLGNDGPVCRSRPPELLGPRAPGLSPAGTRPAGPPPTLL